MVQEQPALRAIARERAARQLISRPIDGTAEAIVSHLLAVQAQDYSGAKWGVGLRGTAITEAAVERALANRKIVRDGFSGSWLRGR
jgi:hypothetical protein